LDRSASQKHVRRPEGMAPTRSCAARANRKPVMWRRQARFMVEGIEGLTREGRQTTAADRQRAESGRSGARAAARRSNPLDRPDVGGGCRRGELAFGATHPQSPPTRAISYPYVQVVERPEFRRETQDVAGLYVDPPAHAVVFSVDRAKSRHSTSPSRVCR
jgi:hypothetical protein